MTLLITLEQAKAHLRIDTDEEDDDLTLKIHASSAAVMSYLKDGALDFTDSSGVITADVPWQVQAAVLVLLGALYGDRGEEGGKPAGFSNYLPPAVVALLYPLRIPTVA